MGSLGFILLYMISWESLQSSLFPLHRLGLCLLQTVVYNANPENTFVMKWKLKPNWNHDPMHKFHIFILRMNKCLLTLMYSSDVEAYSIIMVFFTVEHIQADKQRHIANAIFNCIFLFDNIYYQANILMKFISIAPISAMLTSFKLMTQMGVTRSSRCLFINQIEFSAQPITNELVSTCISLISKVYVHINMYNNGVIYLLFLSV